MYTDAPDGSYALRAFYEKGSISPGHTPGDLTHGFSLYSKTGIDLSEGTEVLFSYKAYFQDGFNFNLGGKMPGLYGGEDDAIAMTCSGGNHGENKCWSARMMCVTVGTIFSCRLLTLRMDAGSALVAQASSMHTSHS